MQGTPVKNRFLAMAISLAGSMPALANIVGVSARTISNWKDSPGKMPLGIAATIANKFNLNIELFKQIKSM